MTQSNDGAYKQQQTPDPEDAIPLLLSSASFFLFNTSAFKPKGKLGILLN